MSKLQQAVVLVDVPVHGLKVGQILEADPALIKALVADSAVDPHKNALAAAREAGAEFVRSRIEAHAERRAVLVAAIGAAEQALAEAKPEDQPAASDALSSAKAALDAFDAA